MSTLKTAAEAAKTLSTHVERVSPGLPAVLPSSAVDGDHVWQGDLCIMAFEGKIPSEYVEVKNPTDLDRQLVPQGGGPGSHHRLNSLKGVRIYRPKTWGQNMTDLDGPIVVIDRSLRGSTPVEIGHEPGHGHPHGTVTVEVDQFRCAYQRNLDQEERARRAAD